MVQPLFFTLPRGGCLYAKVCNEIIHVYAKSILEVCQINLIDNKMDKLCLLFMMLYEHKRMVSKVTVNQL